MFKLYSIGPQLAYFLIAEISFIEPFWTVPYLNIIVPHSAVQFIFQHYCIYLLFLSLSSAAQFTSVATQAYLFVW